MTTQGNDSDNIQSKLNKLKVVGRYAASPFGILYNLIRGYFFAMAGAAVAAFILRVFVLEAFRIPSDFMHPTLVSGDHIFVSKLSYLGSKPKRSDVVVFNFSSDPRKDYIKRVVAIGGDFVEIRDGSLLINDVVISSEVGKTIQTETLDGHAYQVSWEGTEKEARNLKKIQVPEGHLFLLSDKRSRTQDSRTWGFLSSTQVKGRASFIWFSIGQDPGCVGDCSDNIRFSRIFKKIN